MTRSGTRLRILMVASEAMPWVKTGGLADAVSGLSAALLDCGHDVRILLPAYADTLAAHPGLRTLANSDLLQSPRRAGVPGAWFCRLPGLSDRPGNPYHDTEGRDWPDNALRFGAFARVAAAVAGGRAGLSWRPDILHCHDWQAGLVPVYMMLQRIPAATVFTIHNLAHRGLFDAGAMPGLELPYWLWHADALEFHGALCFLKGGLAFADRLTTVSPGYAREICTPGHGQGLDGLLRHRASALHGILNGIDVRAWNPADDPALPATFHDGDLSGKTVCKRRLQAELGLPEEARTPLLGVVSRLVAQKGIDLILEILPALLARGCQLVVLGRGERQLENALVDVAGAHPGQVVVRLGYDEALAHRIEAGADLFLMPSRFEPCGLNQMYSQHYGTPPVVHATGGLSDSVIDVGRGTRPRSGGTGFTFAPASGAALLEAVDRALALYQRPAAWARVQRAGMVRDFSWNASAVSYQDLYRAAMNES